MMHIPYSVLSIVMLAALLNAQESSGDPPAGSQTLTAAGVDRSTYTLGPGDQLTIWALGAEEVTDKPFRIDPAGDLDLPLIGRVKAAGQTVAELEAVLRTRLRVHVRQPAVSVNVTEMRSQPVSVLGAVNTPGVQQLQGSKTLFEVIALAGGVRADAGPAVRITRQISWGRIPLPSAHDDASGQYSVAEVSLKSILEAESPERNIAIRPNDVISVARAEMVYVIGQVNKSGGFVLNDRETLSVLKALSLAGGLNREAAPRSARILRTVGGKRVEVAVNVKRILSGKSPDLPLEREDVLFIPNDAIKSAGERVLETGISIGTGLVIWRR